MRDRWQLVGQEIRAARAGRAWSQDQLAAAAHLTQMQVSRDERGPAKGIDSSRLSAYIEVLDLDEHKLLAIIHGPAAGAQDLELQVKLRAVAEIPGLSEADRLEVEALIRARHRPTPARTLRPAPPRRGGAGEDQAPPTEGDQAP